jgi:hypothetical protein
MGEARPGEIAAHGLRHALSLRCACLLGAPVRSDAMGPWWLMLQFFL